jgi:hypothetical protein
MPVVLIRYTEERRPTAVPSALIELLKTEAGMDSAEAASASENLLRGREVETWFDYGENAAATEFARKVLALGVDTTVPSDATLEKADRINRFKSWLVPGLLFVIVLIGAIAQEPLYGVILLAVAAGGVSVFLIIRSINRNT